MIPVDCECGKTLKVKDEHAGKKVRCPGCSAVLRVPEPSASEDEWEVAEEEPALPPRPKKSSKSKKGKKSRSSASGFKGGLKKGFGVLAIVLGLAIGAGIGYMAFWRREAAGTERTGHSVRHGRHGHRLGQRRNLRRLRYAR